MMGHIAETVAVYENGVLKPIEPLDLVEGEKYIITLSTPTQDKRPVDLFPGKYTLPEGFDEPLPDEFWLGDEK